MAAETIQELNTGANACSVEWCPFANLEDYVACSTYLLDRKAQSPMFKIESSEGLSRTRGQDDCPVGGSPVADAAHQHQTRKGTVGLHKLVYSDSDLENTHGLQFAKLGECGWRSLNGGVLDTKWMEHPLSDSTAVLACATSIGRLVLYEIQLHADGEDTAQLQMLSTSDDEDVLLLSLDWNGGKGDDSKIVVSRSDGQLAVWRMRPGSSTHVMEGDPWAAHKLRGGIPTEAWISFYRKGARHSDAEFVVSGGDDGMMKGWDLRSCRGGGASPAFVSKHHHAGVTAGQWHPHREHVFTSGSYDESVRIWDIRNMRDPISTFSTGGGLWRLKWHPLPEKSDILLAACMHAGVLILDTDTAKASSSNLETGDMGEALFTRYTRHESMAYGADWCRVPQVVRSSCGVVASCSFYDNLYCLWQTPLSRDGVSGR